MFCGHEVASGVKSVSAVLLHYALYECDCTVKESLVKSGGTVQAVRIVPDTTPFNYAQSYSGIREFGMTKGTRTAANCFTIIAAFNRDAASAGLLRLGTREYHVHN